jgi:hypothetical protein
MTSQISRDSFDPSKRYSGVHLQQGRMITDADWNEQSESIRQRLDDALTDVVTGGVPREGGLGLEAVAGQPLRLRRGRVYAGGVGALVTGTPTDPTQAFGLDEQVDLPLPAGTVPPAVSYRVYADVWQRVVTSIEDPDQLRDPALHGADTATRTQTMAQVKWCGPAVDPEDPTANPPQGDARTTITLRSRQAGLDPCDPCAREISVPSNVGNYLFRLQVHSVEGGPRNPTGLVLKWSSENGAEQHVLDTEPPDFRGGDWLYEHFTTRSEQHLGVHLEGGLEPAVGTLVEGTASPAPAEHPFVRRWDGYVVLRRQSGGWSLVKGSERGVALSTSSAADADGHVTIGAGRVAINLSTLTLDLTLGSQQAFVAGDHWLVAVRDAVHEPGDVVLASARPAGVRHHYLLLGTVDGTGAFVTPDRDRQQRLDFPSLTSLEARDVDFTADCGSGLFDATHDTVQKALDRICELGAEHVAFAKPCDTSVFKGVAANSVDTVAKALALLCDVRAEHVAYAPGSACTDLGGVTTVKQAIDRLCERKPGGGCRPTVGDGGDFQTLEEAVEVLRERGETGWCLCLLPGEHVVEGELHLSPDEGGPLHLSLQGCGPASGLRLEAPVTVSGAASVRLRDLALDVGSDGGLHVGGGEEVTIDDCRIVAHEREGSPPLRVAGTRLVRLAGNDVRALREGHPERVVKLFDGATGFGKVLSKELTDEEARKVAREAAARLAAMPADERRKLAEELKQALAELRKAEPGSLGPTALEAFARFLDLLTARSRTLDDDLHRALLHLRDAVHFSETDVALVIGSEGGLVDVRGNTIDGLVSFDGMPAEEGVLEELVHELGELLRGRSLGSAAVEESLVVTGNQVSGFRVGGELLERTHGFLTGDGDGPLAGLFRTVRLTDNVLTADGSVVLGAEATLSGNRFAGHDVPATVVADAAFYLGNHGPPGDHAELVNLAPRSNGQTRADLNTIGIHDA